jgi:hypothetical protein
MHHLPAGTSCYIHVMNNITLAGLAPYPNLPYNNTYTGYFNITNHLTITGTSPTKVRSFAGSYQS